VLKIEVHCNKAYIEQIHREMIKRMRIPLSILLGKSAKRSPTAKKSAKQLKALPPANQTKEAETSSLSNKSAER